MSLFFFQLMQYNSLMARLDEQKPKPPRESSPSTAATSIESTSTADTSSTFVTSKLSPSAAVNKSNGDISSQMKDSLNSSQRYGKIRRV